MLGYRTNAGIQGQMFQTHFVPSHVALLEDSNFERLKPSPFKTHKNTDNHLAKTNTKSLDPRLRGDDETDG